MAVVSQKRHWRRGILVFGLMSVLFVSPTGAATRDAAAPHRRAAGSDHLNPNESLTAGQYIQPSSATFRLTMQSDGNLVLYFRTPNPDVPMWATSWLGAPSIPGSYAIMQGDGNFVLYSPTGTALWHTHTYMYPGSYLTIGVDGNVIVYQSGTPRWYTALYQSPGGCHLWGTTLVNMNTYCSIGTDESLYDKVGEYTWFVQRYLQYNGWLSFIMSDYNGVFGTDTYNAVYAYQYSRGIPPNGIVGSATWAQLENILDNQFVCAQDANYVYIRTGTSGCAVYAEGTYTSQLWLKSGCGYWKVLNVNGPVCI